MADNVVSKKYYKVEELADALGVKKFVIRTWEKQFELNHTENQYNQTDFEIFKAIRTLIYEQQLSHDIAKQRLPEIILQMMDKASTPQNTPLSNAVSEIVDEASSNQTIENEIVAATISEHLESEHLESEHLESEHLESEHLDSETLDANPQVQPALKQEEFWTNIKSFKDQLLKIHEQLK